MFARTFTGRATRMAIPRWENVETGPLGERMIRLLERYPKADEIYITSAKDGDHGPTSHHYGLSYQGSPTAAIDIGAGGFPAGSAKMRDVARWLYDNFADYTVELIHTTPFQDDDGFYVKNQVRNPGGSVYGEPTKSAHLNHVHWAMSADLMTALERAAGPAPLRDVAVAHRGRGARDGIALSPNETEQAELLELLAALGPLTRRIEDLLARDDGAGPAGSDYWNLGSRAGFSVTRGLDEAIGPDVHERRGRYISGRRTAPPSARALPRTRGVDARPEAAARGLEPINPGPPTDRAIKIRDVTGPGGLSDQFGMAATDLGVLTLTPSGRILAIFGDTFRDAFVGSPDWRATVGLVSDTKNLDEGLVWAEAAGHDRHYARQ